MDFSSSRPPDTAGTPERQARFSQHAPAFPTPGLRGAQVSLSPPPHQWERDKEGEGKQHREVVTQLDLGNEQAWVQNTLPC